MRLILLVELPQE